MKHKFEQFYFSAWGDENFIDITEWFKNEYVEKGRCLFDGKHDVYFEGAENRYSTVDENHKVCNWCGCSLEKKIEYIPHEKFVPVLV